MSEQGTERREQRAAEDGWFLAKPSWPFHRSVWRAIGRALECGEYSSLLSQIRRGQAELLRFGDQGALYRVALRDGTSAEVLVRERRRPERKPMYDLLSMPPRRRAKMPKHEDAPPAPPPAPCPPPLVASPPLPEPPPAPATAPRASTLTLGAKTTDAAELLAERLRPKPPPPRAEKAPPPAKKKGTDDSRPGTTTTRPRAGAAAAPSARR